MKQKLSIAEAFQLYEKSVNERDALVRGGEADQKELMSAYRALQGEALGFCRSEGFLSIMQVLCRINAGKLTFSLGEGKIAFMGKTPPALTFDHQSCFAVKDEAKEMMLAVRSGSPRDEAAIGRLCVGYVTLTAIAGAAKELYRQALDEKAAAREARLSELTDVINACEATIRAGADTVKETEENDGKGIFVASRSVMADAALSGRLQQAFHLEGALPQERISLRSDGCSAVFLTVTDAQKETVAFHDFINGLFYRNFQKFCVGELSVACAEDNTLSSLPLSQFNARLLTHDQSETNLFSFSYGSVAQTEETTGKLLQSVVDEMNERKPLLGVASHYADIDDYNQKNPYNKKAKILLLMNGYSHLLSSDKSYQNLQALMKDGGKYGIFTVVMGQPEPVPLNNGEQGLLDLAALGAKALTFGDPAVQFVSADGAAVDTLRREARATMKQSEILYLDELLERRPAVSHFSREMTIPVGLADGKIYYFATSVDGSKSEYHSSPFTLIIGSTGMGKSAFLHTLILSGGMCYSPDELQFYIVDFKAKEDSAEFSCYLHKEGEENLYIPHVRYLSMKSTAENAYDVLDMIDNLAGERAALFSSVGAKDFIAYNSDPRITERVKAGELPHVPQIYFLIDEYITMLSGGVGGDNEARAELENKFSDILQRIRTSGVGLIFSGQRCVFKNSTMGLIGNRIAFDPGNENLLTSMFNFDYGMGEDSGALYRRIGGKIGTAAAIRNAGSSVKEVVRTAFAGKHMGERQRALAKAIREKYSDPRYYGKQIVPGEDVMENGDSFLSEACSAPVPREEILRQSREKDLKIPLYLGVSSMASKPVPLRYYLQKQQGALVFAKAPKQEKIEMNAALSFLHYLAVNGHPSGTPTVTLDDMTAQEYLTDVFGNVIEGSSGRHALIEVLEQNGLSHLCTLNRTATAVAASIMEAETLWNDRMSGACRDRTPRLLILHDADGLCSLQRLLDLEAHSAPTKAEPAPVAEKKDESPTLSDNELSAADLRALLSNEEGGNVEDEILANLFNADVNVDDIEIGETVSGAKDGRRYTEAEVLAALRHLMKEGNRQSIFVLLACSERATTEKLLGIRLEQRDACKALCAAVFGSDAVRKTLDVSMDKNADCCFVLPQEIKTRLYDFSAGARDWWKHLKNHYQA
ncbi:MAG: hypothetical protein IJX39_05385 [Clostridia bacterium]|nr:hypothetical protein [Clostridia bacterium]